MRNVNISRLLIATLLIFSVFAFSGCSLFSSPQNVFSPAGDVAQRQKDLYFETMWPGLAVLLLVELGLVFIMIRFRRRKTDTQLPPQIHGNNKLEIAWTIAPMIMLAFFIVPTVSGIIDLGRTPKDAITVDVTAERFRWSFSYEDPNGGPPVVAQPGEAMHIPINRNIVVRLHAVDVIHSFWVPRLAGKTDVIPGRTNHMWFNATEIGSFSGQCAEFCGTGHSDMRFTVTSESADDFQAWLKTEQAAAQPPADEPKLAFQGD